MSFSALLPQRRLLILTGIWLGCGLVAVWVPPALEAWRWTGLALLAAALADGFLARQAGAGLAILRQMPQIWPVGVEQGIRLRLSGAPGRVVGELIDDAPPSFQGSGEVLAFALAAGQWLELPQRLRPTERGEHRFGNLHLRLDSPLGLWHRQRRIEQPQLVRVFPDFAKVARYALLATDDRLAQMGVLRRRRRGEGLDFHQLREYRRDDSPRQIDWKATARMGKPISREYQDERDQQIVFLLDCGQRMRSRDGDLSHFDHTLNALLLLSYVALRQGDAVGFATFAGAGPRFFPPKKSMPTVQNLLRATYDLQPTLATPDYLAAAETLCSTIHKRSLVVVLTNLRDEDDDTLHPALAQLRRRHLVLLANLREGGLDTVLAEPIGDFDQALTWAAGLEYRQRRQIQLGQLRARGIQVLDVAPPGLPVALVNRYWEMKRGGMI